MINFSIAYTHKYKIETHSDIKNLKDFCLIESGWKLDIAQE